MNYFIKGIGDPLIFIHGALGFNRNFNSISEALKEKHKSLLYDQRGHGKSFHAEPYTVEQLAKDLNELLDKLSFSKPSLVGHSLGGFVALVFASLYPEKINKLVIVDSSPVPSKDRGEEIINRIKNLPAYFKDYEEARHYFHEEVENKNLTKVMADFLFANLSSLVSKKDTTLKNENAVFFQFDRQGVIDLIKDTRNYNYWPIIKNLKCPTLYLRGENSTHFFKEDFDKVVKSNPVIQGISVKAAGHWLHHEQPKVFIETLKHFL